MLGALTMLLCSGTADANAEATAAYQISSGPTSAQFEGTPSAWGGQHAFADVFCLRFPDAAKAGSMLEAMFNNNTLYYSRAGYPDSKTFIHVVTSMLPATLSPRAEFEAQRTRAETQAQATSTHIQTRVLDSGLGPVVSERIRNVSGGDASRPFPFERALMGDLDSPLHTLSVHRSITNNGSRIELAVLRTFAPALPPEDEDAAAAAVEILADRSVEALVECTTAMNHARRAPDLAPTRPEDAP